VEEAAEQAKQLLQQPGWNDLPAVLTDRVFAVNANAYFARPGPRVVDGVELLAHLIHPELWDWRGSRNAFRQIHFSQWKGDRLPTTKLFDRRQDKYFGTRGNIRPA
jgi:hypothetical protein